MKQSSFGQSTPVKTVQVYLYRLKSAHWKSEKHTLLCNIMTYKPLVIHFSAVFRCLTDQKQPKEENQNVEPGESVICKKPIVLSIFYFFQTYFY